MTLLTPQITTESFDVTLGVISRASVQILALLDAPVAERIDPDGFWQQLESARLSLGSWAEVARRLHLNDAEMTRFSLQLRHLQQQLPDYDAGRPVTQEQRVAALRFITSLDVLKERLPTLTYSTQLGIKGDGHMAAVGLMRQLEMALRDLVSHSSSGSVPLIKHVKSLFGSERVRRWLKRAGGGEVIAAMPFTDIASMLVDRKEFEQHYTRLYQAGSGSSDRVDQCKILQIYLDDLRQIRNLMLAGHRTNDAQFLLVEHYSHEILGPIQQAWDERRCAVNPAAWGQADSQQLQSYLNTARRLAVSGEEQIPVREFIERPDKQRSSVSPRVIEHINTMLWGAIAVMAVIVVVGGASLYHFNSPTAPKVEAQVTEVIQPHSRANATPRDTLSNLGIGWDENNMRSAIDRGDTSVVRLFLLAGMHWRLSWTEQALAHDDEDIIRQLLRFPALMTEQRPCRRAMSTLGRAMLDGQKLTSMRQWVLLTFCKSPKVVQRQKYDADQAQKRLIAEQARYQQARARGEKMAPPDGRWAAIQQQIYEVVQ